MSIGLLLTVFVFGFTMPQLNIQLGWSKLCAKAIELSEERKITDYYVYEISRVENMDVYLNKDVHKVSKEEIVGNLFKNKLLLKKEKKVEKDSELEAVIKTKEHYQIGKYFVVVF